MAVAGPDDRPGGARRAGCLPHVPGHPRPHGSWCDAQCVLRRCRSHQVRCRRSLHTGTYIYKLCFPVEGTAQVESGTRHHCTAKFLVVRDAFLREYGQDLCADATACHIPTNFGKGGTLCATALLPVSIVGIAPHRYAQVVCRSRQRSRAPWHTGALPLR